MIKKKKDIHIFISCLLHHFNI